MPPVFLSWEITSQCNLNCSYCYYKPTHTNIFSKELILQKLILKKIATIEEEINMTILGGEPSLHPNFFEIIETLYNISNITKILIITNFTKPLTFWKRLSKFKDKIEINISLHLEYFSDTKLLKIDNFITQFKTNILLLQPQNELQLERFNKIIKYSNDKNWLTFTEIELIKLSAINNFNPSSFFELYFDKKFKKDQPSNNKGLKCFTKKILITYDGKIIHPCTNYKLGEIFTFDFIKYLSGIEICKAIKCDNKNYQTLITQ